MSSLTRLIRFLVLALVCALPAAVVAQEFSALARVAPESVSVEKERRGLSLSFRLSHPVPWRAFTLTDPEWLVLDFGEVDWSGLGADLFTAPGRVSRAAAGRLRPGWSRLVLELEGPYGIETAAMETAEGQGARLALTLSTVSEAAFAAASGAPESAVFALPEPARGLLPPRTRQQGDRPLVVVLDPGHGGIDPGAERDGAREADLVLTFARELREVLLRAGGFEVTLTRDADVFVPLERRQSIAREAGADAFISLHADALAEGQASGATVYTMSETASDLASQKLAERHDRADLLAGVDLTAQDDVVASVLMDLARTETQPRSERLADHLVRALGSRLGRLHKRPKLSAAFSVLKAPDIPSVLVELGFMSNPRDLANLRNPEWRANAALAIRDALQGWAVEDAAEAALVRQ